MHDLLFLKVCTAWRKHRDEYNVTVTNKFWILPQINNISLFSPCCFQMRGTVVSDSEFKICEASQMCDHLSISESLKFEFFLELNRLSSKNNSITQINFYTGSIDYEQSLFFLRPSNKTRENTHARDWRRETVNARKKRDYPHSHREWSFTVYWFVGVKTKFWLAVSN